MQDEVSELRGRGDRAEDSFNLRLATFSEQLGLSHLNHVNLEKTVFRSRQDIVSLIDGVRDSVKVLAGGCDSFVSMGGSLTMRISAVECDLQSLRAGGESRASLSEAVTVLEAKFDSIATIGVGLPSRISAVENDVRSVRAGFAIRQ